MRHPTFRPYRPSLAPLASKSLLLTALLTISSAVTAGAYTVAAGDALFHIARAHDVPVETLKRANGLTSNRVHAGQSLVIPLEERLAADGDDEDSEQGERSTVESRLAAVGQTGIAAAGGAGGKGKKDSEEADSEEQASAEPEEEGQASAAAQDEVATEGTAEPESESPTEDVAAADAAAGECVAKTVEEDSHERDPHWTYDGEAGPEHWADLSPKFEKCGTGMRQTPIDLASSEAVPMGLEDVQFQYGAVEATVLNNGHTVQVNVPEGNVIALDGVIYVLAQFHFHSPSEHTIDGASYPLELHLVHKDEQGNLAVVGVMLEKGEKNPVLAQVWSKMPKTQGKESALKGQIDLNGLLPADRSAYRYLGSLTTPPCSEGVKWIVMKSSVTMTTKQIAAFKKVFPMNARPLQPINARSIVEDVTASTHAAN